MSRRSIYSYWQQQLTPLTRRLMLFAVGNVVLVTLALLALPSTGVRDVGLYDVGRSLFFRSGTDSWNTMQSAWQYLHSPTETAPVYQTVFFSDKTKFVYPLTSLLPMEAIDLVAPGDGSSAAPLMLTSWLAMWATGIFVALIFLRSLDEYAPQYAPRTAGERILLAATMLGMSLTFYPLAKAPSLGQMQTWINAIFAGMIWLWMTNRRVAAGIAGGFICAIKPQLGLLLLWGVLRRHWSFSAAFASTLAAIGVASLVTYGFVNNIDYLNVLSFLSQHGEAFYSNQSMNGFLNRLLSNGPNLSWTPNGYPPYNGTIYIATLVTSAIVIGAALFWRAPGKGRSHTFDLFVASLSFTIASPIAWEHHYGILMPMYAALLPAMLRWPVVGRWSVPVLGACYVLSSNYFHVAQEAARYPLLTPVQSYLFLSALVLLAVLYGTRQHDAVREGELVA